MYLFSILNTFVVLFFIFLYHKKWLFENLCSLRRQQKQIISVANEPHLPPKLDKRCKKSIFKSNVLILLIEPFFAFMFLSLQNDGFGKEDSRRSGSISSLQPLSSPSSPTNSSVTMTNPFTTVVSITSNSPSPVHDSGSISTNPFLKSSNPFTTVNENGMVSIEHSNEYNKHVSGESTASSGTIVVSIRGEQPANHSKVSARDIFSKPS